MTKRSLSPAALRFASALKFGAGESSFSAGDLRPFSGIAYTGGVVTDHWFWSKVVFDLSTTRPAAEVLPVLFDHDTRIPLGNGTISVGTDISIDGVIYDDADGQKVLGKPGHPWQMSVYIKPGRIEELQEGSSVVVNGILFEGPGVVFRDNVVKEASIVTFGADPNTSASLAFSASDKDLEIEITAIGAPAMTPEEIAALQAKVAELEAANVKFAADAAAAAAAAAASARATRFAAVKTMFSATGKTDVTEAEAAPYLSMTEEQFAAVSSAMTSFKASLPEHLFREQATETTAAAPPQKSALLLDAERRAAAAKK